MFSILRLKIEVISVGTLTTYQIISLVISLVGIPSIGAVVGWIWKTQKTRNKIHETESFAIKNGLQAVLRDRLLQCYNFHKKKGSVTYLEKANFENMYKSYHNLGANGVMDDVYNSFMALPVDGDEI